MAKLDDKRVDVFYEKLTGEKPERGTLERRETQFCTENAYIEQACASVLSAIRDLEQAAPDADITVLERALRTEFKFLDTLQE